MTPKELYELFRATYLAEGDVRLHAWSAYEEAPGVHRFVCTLEAGDRTRDYEGTGGSRVSAFVDALAGAGHGVDVVDFAEQEDGTAVYAECRVDGRTAWGAGVGSSAAVQAVLSALNRAMR
ncbi:alpha-isopropylmalate synthase regulatory domain-containing protein [Streptomyces canus]|uniref:alpha-isopropylmalate synthase regulatory domain-containing protein n=1 Tax=Streptomyces canus TaxID=58343 RepID=UPI002E26AFCC|nr:alpha-isopropylmalate synthase regulatory domain-containing protein [Streptomyces canus]